MRRFRLSMSLALALSGIAYSGAQALPLECTVGVAVHNHARITLKGKT